MTKIKAIEASEVLNANGLPAIEVMVVLNDGKTGITSCPAGENMGSNESLNLGNNNENRLEVQSVSKAIGNIKNVIASSLIGKEVESQPEIDKVMIDLDGTQDKSRLGASAMFAVSMAVAKAGAESSVLPLFLYLRQFIKKGHDTLRMPVPIFDFVNERSVDGQKSDFHEFLVIPASSKSYTQSLQIGESIYKSLRGLINAKYATHDYEEAFVPNLSTNKDTLELIQQAIVNTSLKPGFDVFLGLNSRASTLFKDGKYRIKDSPSPLSSKDLINYYIGLNNSIHMLYLEDPLDQNDWDGWVSLFEKMSKSTIIAGGDLIATNPYRLQMAIDKKAANAIIIKPNQLGTVIESLAIAEAAKETGLRVIVSHRTKETNDDFLSDFSVAVSADYIKAGSLSRGENIAKYNRLLQIDNQLKVL